jgi:hypothetical protein
MLECISQRWFSSIHDTESRQSPNYFIQWAEALGFQIEWSNWAQGKNLPNKYLVGESITSSTEAGRPKGGIEKYWTAEKIAELATFRASHTMKETAECFGISAQRIRLLISKHDEANRPPPTANDPFQLFKMRR